MKNYDVLDDLVPKTQELHRAIFDKGYEQGQKDILEQEPCEDCISRQAVLACKQTFHDNAGYETEYVDIEDIQALPSVEPKEKTKWIPVTERLPEERKTIIGSDVFIDPSEEVLVQMKSGWMHVTRYWGSRERYKNRPWIDLNYPTTDEVIAWMPRPESYKAESEVNE